MLQLIFILSIIISLFFYTSKQKKPTTTDIFSDDFDPSKVCMTLNSSGQDQSIVLKESSFDTSRIKSYDGEDMKNFEFRPQNFKQFIGQEDAKEKAKTIMSKARRGIKSHFLVDGIKGHGKTTYVELLAKQLDAKLIERIGRQIDEDGLVNIVNEINSSEEEFVVFFIDEFETMDWKLIKILNPMIESFKISGKKIKPFTFVGATINKHILLKNNPDTLDRIPPSHHIKFERYNSEEIKAILFQYKEQLYGREIVASQVMDSVSKNCKFNPRTSIALLEDFIIEGDINKVLKNSKIIRDGLTAKDIDILQALSMSTRAMGANALAMKAKLNEKEYITEFEPFLVEYGYIDRVPSRVITDKGRELLEQLKEIA